MDQLTVRAGEPLTQFLRPERPAVESDRGRAVAHHQPGSDRVQAVGDRAHRPRLRCVHPRLPPGTGPGPLRVTIVPCPAAGFRAGPAYPGPQCRAYPPAATVCSTAEERESQPLDHLAWAMRMAWSRRGSPVPVAGRPARPRCGPFRPARQEAIWMGLNVAQKLIGAHLVDGQMTPGEEIGLRIDQTLTQDATGTMVMLELEALGLDRVRTQVSVQYVDHNLLQADERNMADHLFLRSACQRFGVWYSRPGNGVSHPVHMQRFGRPGASLAGSDSHTCAAGSLGMLAIGVGGLEVAMAMAGEPLYVTMPEIWGVRLAGALPPWVSAKDVILEMLRRHGVKGGVGRIIEYHGPGLGSLSAMDRHVIANMGAELGATTSVFPADEQVRTFLEGEGRGGDFTAITADPDAAYDVTDEIDLAALEPLIARPSSTGNVVPVREAAGEPVFQAMVGSSANPGLRDFAIVAAITSGRLAHPQVP